MIQGTPEWHAARAGKITASMVGAILGLSPFMTQAQAKRALVRSMLGAPDEFAGNPATQWGNANEEQALAMYELETTHKVERVGFIEARGDDAEWAGCSPDGLVEAHLGVELKCPYSLRRAVPPVAFKGLDEQPHYEAQIQFSLWVTGRKAWHFFQWCPTDTKGPVVVYPDEGWQKDNLPILRAFHAECKREAAENPGDYLAAPRITIDTPEAHKMVQEMDDIREQEALLAERKRDLLDSMVAMAGEANAEFAGRKLTLVEKEGSVSYARAMKELLPTADLAPYRGKPSKFWRLG